MSVTNKELVGASTAILILGVLKRAPSYGYDIVRQINQEAEGVFTWQEGTIYPLLHKLERQVFYPFPLARNGRGQGSQNTIL